MNLFLLKILAHVLLLLDSGSHTNCCYEPLHRKHVVVVLLFADADNASWELLRWSQTEKLIGGNVVFNETVMDGVCSWDRWSVPSSQQWPMLWWSKVLQILVPWLVSPSNNKLFFFYAMRQFRSESLDEILFVPLMVGEYLEGVDSVLFELLILRCQVNTE